MRDFPRGFPLSGSPAEQNSHFAANRHLEVALPTPPSCPPPGTSLCTAIFSIPIPKLVTQTPPVPCNSHSENPARSRKGGLSSPPPGISQKKKKKAIKRDRSALEPNFPRGFPLLGGLAEQKSHFSSKRHLDEAVPIPEVSCKLHLPAAHFLAKKKP